MSCALSLSLGRVVLLPVQWIYGYRILLYWQLIRISNLLLSALHP